MAAEIGEEYLSSLADLNVNSKPLINMLTIIAEENIEHAAVIVRAVKQHLDQVNPDVKLPVLYLIDSIVKNVGGNYVDLFENHIVKMFCGVFEKVNEKVREKMFALRQTWNEVFKQEKLHTLDKSVKCMDENWPITAKQPKTPSTIHVNPDFLKNRAGAMGDPKLTEMQAQLRDKKRELLELEKHKIELELAAMKQRIEEDEKKINLQAASVKMVNPRRAGVMPPATVSVAVPPPQMTFMPQRPGFRPGMPGFPPGAIMTHGHPRFTNAMPPIVPMQPGKMRVAPVNPALVSSLQMRDPRLMRQMQQQQQQQQQQQMIRPPGIRPDGFPPNISPRDDGGASKSGIVSGKSSSSSRSRENNSKSSSRSHSSGKSSSSGRTSKSSKSSPAKVKDKEKMSPSDKERSRRDSSSSSSSSKNGKHRSRSNERSKSERKEHHHTTSAEKSPKSTTKESSPSLLAIPSEVPATTTTTAVNVVTTAVAAAASGLAPSVGMFRDMKLAPGTRSFRKPASQRRSKSPSPPAPPSLSVVPAQRVVADVDLRIPPSTVVAAATPLVEENKKQMTKGPSTSPEKNSSENNEKKKLIDSSLADVDLRQFPAAQEPQPVTAVKQPGEEKELTKKRSIEEKDDTVASKKSKSDNSNQLDVLFGTQDVDLRTLGAIKAAASTAEALTPPPPPVISKENDTNWPKSKVMMTTSNIRDHRVTGISLQSDTTTTTTTALPKKMSQSKASLAAIRAKLAVASKRKKSPPPQVTEILERKRKHNSRFSNIVEVVPEVAALKAELLADESTSQDANDASIKIIVAQAQEQLDNESIDQEQYNSMMKQMMQLNETKKLMKAQKREANDDARRKLMNQVKPAPAIESSFATTTAADLRRAEQTTTVRPTVWNTSATTPWMMNTNTMQTVTPWNNPLLAEMIQKQLALQATYKASTGKKTIKIDEVERDIRFYEDIAIVFIGDLPKEIGFQAGQRKVTCDGEYPIVLSFNAANTPWIIDGVTHQIRLGCPTRELYIDNEWYEAFFGSAIPVKLNGVSRMILVDGPPPQARIGSVRTDLVVGKINMVVNQERVFEVFLDGQKQDFELDGKKLTLQFADFLKTVIINEHAYPVKFGDLEHAFDVSGKKQMIRFTALPAGIIPGECFIRNMPLTDLQLNLKAPAPPSSATTAAAALAAAAAENPSLQATKVASATVEESTSTEVSTEEVAVKPAPMSIDDLFKNLLASGILGSGSLTSMQKSSSGKSSRSDSNKMPRERNAVRPVDLSKPETIRTRQGAIVHQLFSGMQCSSCGVRFPPEQTMKYSQHLDWHFRQNRRDRASARKAHSREWYYEVTDWIQYEEIEDLEEREKNWFETQQLELDADKEDSNQRGGAESPIPSCPALPDDSNRVCEVCHDPFEQFYHEETEEWHLKQAIRVEDRTYHPLCYADYQASLNESSKISESAEDDTAATEDDVNMVELDDDEEDSVVVVKQEPHDPELVDKERNLTVNLVPNGPTHVPGLEGDDDDVIEVAPVEPVITEILDDDEDVAKESSSPVKSTSVASLSPTKSHNPLDESDVEIQEPHIPIQEIVDDEETPTVEQEKPDFDKEAEEAATKAATEMIMKIKEEPKDDEGYNEDDAFMDVGTSFDPNEEMIIDEETLDERPQLATTTTATQNGQDGEKTPADAADATTEASGAAAAGEEDVDVMMTTTKETPQMIATLDGNVEMMETTSTIAPTTNRIKINISNSVVVGNKGQSSINSSVSVSDTRDAAGATVVDLKPAAVKATVSAASLKLCPPFANGHETSGLCSIM
ncbi:hypothetical protein DMENIID0001_138570 [Sergentomyia squamirostris]